MTNHPEFDAAMRKTVDNPIVDAIIPGLSSNPHTARRQIDAVDLRRRMKPEWLEQDRRSFENWLAGGDGMIDEWKVD